MAGELGHAAEVHADNDKADDVAVVVPDGGVGGVLRAHGAGLVGGVGGGPCQGIGLGGAGVGGVHQIVVRGVEQVGLGVAHQYEVNVPGVLGGLIQKLRQLLGGALPLQGLLNQVNPGENGGGVDQGAV